MYSLQGSDTLVFKLQQNLCSFPLKQFSRESGFIQRERKLTAFNYLLGFFIMLLSGGNSLSCFSTTIGLLSGFCLSKQALDNHIKAPLLKFLELVLACVLLECIRLEISDVHSEIFSSFNRILLQDSTCVRLPDELSCHYPGSQNWSKNTSAILKIQAILNLKSERFLNFSVSPYTRNDQSAAGDIIPIVKPKDLIIRDLGYFSINVLKQIEQKNAYFLSRLRYQVNLYKTDGETPFDLLDQLKKYGQLDVNICIGSKEKFPVRLVALPVSEQVANQRRRKYKTTRDKRVNPSKERLALLGWDIFITNVEPEKLSIIQVAQIYQLRWRIEICFKTWKSHFHLTNVPKANLIRVQTHIYASLILITIFQNFLFVNLITNDNAQNEIQISLLKLAKFCNEQLWAMILFCFEPEKIEKQILYHCTYEKRNNKSNYYQTMNHLS